VCFKLVEYFLVDFDFHVDLGEEVQLQLDELHHFGERRVDSGFYSASQNFLSLVVLNLVDLVLYRVVFVYHIFELVYHVVYLQVVDVVITAF
jgi:hypothetical protein